MPDNNREAFEQIAKEDGTGALAMVVSYLDRSAAANDKLMNSLYEGERTAHERTKERLNQAEAQLAAVHSRLMAIMYDPPGINPLDTGDFR